MHKVTIRGLGYTYGDAATAVVIRDTLSKTVEGLNAMADELECDGCAHS
jgi:hypothetical protein